MEEGNFKIQYSTFSFDVRRYRVFLLRGADLTRLSDKASRERQP